MAKNIRVVWGDNLLEDFYEERDYEIIQSVLIIWDKDFDNATYYSPGFWKLVEVEHVNGD